MDHIWDPGAERIARALGSLGFKYRSEPPGEKAEISLPTISGKYPLPSTPLLGEIPNVRFKKHDEPRMQRWRVEYLPLDVSDILALAPLFSGTGAPSADGRLIASGVMIALDLCYIAECWKFALSLLERGKFLPDIRMSLSGEGEARYESLWRPLIADDDAERFARLSGLMPSILMFCRDESEAASPREVLHEMFDCITDGLVRASWNNKRRNSSADDLQLGRKLAGSLVARAAQSKTAAPGRKRRGRFVGAFNPHLLWARSLGWLGTADGLSASLESIYQDVREWWSRFEWFVRAPYKLCVKLAENSGAWRLEYMMKFSRFGEVIPARAVWSGNLRFIDAESGYYMRRCLFLSLGRIGALIKPVMRSLEEFAPSGCDLTIDEAAEFLLFQASMLENNGVKVYFPDWWKRASSERLTLRGRLLQGSPPPNFFRGAVMPSGKPLCAEQLTFKWEIAVGGMLLSDDEEDLLTKKGSPLIFVRERWIFVRPEHAESICRLRDNLPLRITAEEAIRLAAKDWRIDGFTGSPELEQVYESLLGGVTGVLEEPSGIRGKLRPYQTRGFSWLSLLSGLGLGACLADDMGLGKTIQTLAMIQHRRDLGELGPVLLICPTSVLENWRMEISRFLPHMSVYMHHGRSRARGMEFSNAIKGCAVVLSSYTVLQRDAFLFNGVSWSGVVLDEAQNIKNPDTNQARAARGIKSGWRVALTGTPVENHIGDLWSIMDFLMPGMLGSRRHFTEEYVKPIQESKDAVCMENLKMMVSPFIMRRMKTDKDIVPDLPNKIETKVFCGLKREQVSLYSDVTRALSNDVLGTSGIKRSGLVLTGLTRIKQICDHPSLVLGDHDLSPERSAKLERMLELAEEMFETGGRILIFTQYVEMGNILKLQLQDRFGKEVLFLHGAIGKDARDKMVRRFQDDLGAQFFILSLRAGGVGLNLTGANHVVMYDRWWNPAVEQQAIDRAYRIGQSRNVQVHIFCCRGTLEERIDELISSKKDIAGKVIESNDNWITELSDAELMRLFSLSSGVLEA
jgi:hypothetical protein